MATLKEIQERKKEVSAQVSAQTRALALGLLAMSWALLTAQDDELKKMTAHAHRGAILGMAIFGSLVLACDLLQYVFYTRDAEQTRQRAESAPDKTAKYASKGRLHVAGAAMYHAKFGFLVCGAVVLAWVFFDLALAP